MKHVAIARFAECMLPCSNAWSGSSQIWQLTFINPMQNTLSLRVLGLESLQVHACMPNHVIELNFMVCALPMSGSLLALYAA